MGTPNSIAHSALTTLLLDDSPHKAALQPHNHVCIPEYNTTRRHRDLASLVRQFSEPPPTKKGKKKNKRKKLQEVTVSPTPPCASDLSVSEGEPSTVQSTEEPFDVILLAVVGILDEIKHQSNVAAWIRVGGLRRSGCDTKHSGLLSKREGKKRCTEEESWVEVEDQENPGGATGNEPLENDAYTSASAVSATTSEESLSSLWFDDPSTVSYWVARGRKALGELGIEIEHGVSV